MLIQNSFYLNLIEIEKNIGSLAEELPKVQENNNITAIQQVHSIFRYQTAAMEKLRQL